MTSKTIYRLFLLAASLVLLALVWAARIAIEFLALCAHAKSSPPPRDWGEHRYSWDYDSYSWEGSPDDKDY
jgi:hypothetical protein